MCAVRSMFIFRASSSEHLQHEAQGVSCEAIKKDPTYPRKHDKLIIDVVRKGALAWYPHRLEKGSGDGG